MAVEDEPEVSDAAQAFVDLQGEVAAMRRIVEALPEAWDENRPPDYSLDLGRIAKGLAAVIGQLDVIKQHPALRLTPEQHSQAVAQAGYGLMREAVQKFDRASLDAERERKKLADLIGTVRTKRDQLLWLIALPVMAFAVTLFASPILLSWLPFGLPSQAAAIVMNDDRWDAGEALMRAGNPDRWNSAVKAWNLVRVNQKEIAACGDAAAKTKKDQRCTITVPAQ